MPKLPENLVKPPVFDNPLRRTMFAEPLAVAAPELARVELPKALPVPVEAPTAHADAESSAKVKSKPKNKPIARVTAAMNDKADDKADDKATARITVRIEDTVRCALETECFNRRVTGEKTNVAEIARTILNEWAAARA